jgi:histone H3/H4
MPSTTEIKIEMKKTTKRCNISADAVKAMIEYYNNKIKDKVMESEEKAISNGEKTIGLISGLSANKIRNEARKNTKLSVSHDFVESVKKELEEDFAKISKRADELCIDDGRKTINEKHIKQAISEIKTIGTYILDNSEINPKDIEKHIFDELGFVSDESVETITIHLCNELNSMLKLILDTSKGRGRGKNMVKLEDVMDGIQR